MPNWLCSFLRAGLERFPTNWGLPRAVVIESQCAADGAAACLWDVSWKNPPLGARVWGPLLAGVVTSSVLAAVTADGDWLARAAIAAVPLVAGVATGIACASIASAATSSGCSISSPRRSSTPTGELEKKFRDLETKIEQLSLLIDLSGAVNATLDPEKIYEQALDRLVHRMGYQGAYLFLVDPSRGVVRGAPQCRATSRTGPSEEIEFRLDADDSATAGWRAPACRSSSTTWRPRPDPRASAAPSARSRCALVAVPLRVHDRIFGVLSVVSQRRRVASTEGDVDLLAAVANHVALAVDRAESFQTIEDLVAGLEDKVRVRTEQLRAANEELRQRLPRAAGHADAAHPAREDGLGRPARGRRRPRAQQPDRVHLLQRRPRSTDFVRRLRTHARGLPDAPLPEADREPIERSGGTTCKVDYALKYLDSMIPGIREGAERTPQDRAGPARVRARPRTTCGSRSTCTRRSSRA